MRAEIAWSRRSEKDRSWHFFFGRPTGQPHIENGWPKIATRHDARGIFRRIWVRHNKGWQVTIRVVWLASVGGFAFSPQQLRHTIPFVSRAWVVGLKLAPPNPARVYRKSREPTRGWGCSRRPLAPPSWAACSRRPLAPSALTARSRRPLAPPYHAARHHHCPLAPPSFSLSLYGHAPQRGPDCHSAAVSVAVRKQFGSSSAAAPQLL